MIPTALADHVEKNNLQGQLKYNLFVGASSGAETENRWARLNMIERRSPHQVGKEISKGINNGNIHFFDKHLSMFPVDLMYGFYTLNKPNNRLDVTIVEASAITEDGGIIPGASVGASPELIQMADKIIIEVNTAGPSFEGLHDITMTDLPPNRKPYLIMSPEDRIGTPHIPVDPEKVIAIVESDYPDQTQPNHPEDDTSRAIASNLIEFLKHEVKHGRLPENLLPIQSGIGNIANAVVGGLAVSDIFGSVQSSGLTSMCSPEAPTSSTSRSGRKSCRTPSWTYSTLGILISRRQHRFASLPTASNVSTITGRSMLRSCSSARSRSLIRPRSSVVWVSSA